MTLNRAQIETLAALHVLQPATVSAVQTYLGLPPANGCDALRQLIGFGLVERRKWQPPDIEITEAMRTGLEPMPHGRTGKRPYLYQLTPAARVAAFYLHKAFQKLPETIE